MTLVPTKSVRAEPVEALPFLLKLRKKEEQGFDKLSPNGFV
jgi:hypothetical protein